MANPQESMDEEILDNATDKIQLHDLLQHDHPLMYDGVARADVMDKVLSSGSFEAVQVNARIKGQTDEAGENTQNENRQEKSDTNKKMKEYLESKGRSQAPGQELPIVGGASTPSAPKKSKGRNSEQPIMEPPIIGQYTDGNSDNSKGGKKGDEVVESPLDTSVESNTTQPESSDGKGKKKGSTVPSVNTVVLAPTIAPISNPPVVLNVTQKSSGM